MKVRNMTSRNGNKVPNQFIIEADNAIYFQSYDTVIAKRDIKTGKVYLDDMAWDYSRTTAKYRNMFLGESTSETMDKIDSGEYELVNLND